ncbi:efflux RND transporter periplasmic adaptor subunit [Methylomonas sp. LWB]|uniref:efflux RND transporter periplasmic adaptor subunit n=1 Tax=Methylomonas sp. LWB TaxID=1905845 RepID=UPI0009F4F909|nr:efflux RND transporter periplasmic adaptor subunit [Methylomonas sp. LWB]
MTTKPIIGAVLILALGGAYWASQRADAANAASRYKTQALTTGDVVQSVSANGTLNPVRMVNVGTQVSGTVRKLMVDYNDKVEQGQVLLELDDATYAAQWRQSNAALASAKAGSALAQANRNRLQGLLAGEHVTQQEYDQAVKEAQAAQAMVEQAQAALEKDRVNLGYTVIRSPVSGVVVERLVDVGQTVAASFQTPTLIRIAQDLTKMQIDSSFAESDIGGIKVGQTAQFTVDAFPNDTFRGNVTQIRLSPIIDQNVVTYDVVIAVDNPKLQLFPGMTAYVNIAIAERHNALLVPNSALRFKPGAESGKSGKGGGGEGGKDQGGNAKPVKKSLSAGTAYVLDADRQPRQVAVEIGLSDNRMTEVLAGELRAGDKVVTGENRKVEKAGGKTAGAMRLF